MYFLGGVFLQSVQADGTMEIEKTRWLFALELSMATAGRKSKCLSPGEFRCRLLGLLDNQKAALQGDLFVEFPVCPHCGQEQ